MNKSIVMDNGTYTSKIGFGGDDHPKYILTSVVGYPLNRNKLNNENIDSEICIADDALKN